MEWIVLFAVWKFLVLDDMDEWDADRLTEEVLTLWRRWLGC